jgi:hypothetical protein
MIKLVRPERYCTGTDGRTDRQTCGEAYEPAAKREEDNWRRELIPTAIGIQEITIGDDHCIHRHMCEA